MSEIQNSLPDSWVQFTDNGLIVKSKSEIMADLDTIDKLSFGSDMSDTSGSSTQSNVMGTAWYTHNELLAQCLASIGSAVKAIYDSTNIMSCTGVNLDNRVLGAGITRKNGESDAALRYRYLIAVSTPSISTSEGLTARLTGAQFQNSDGNIISIESVLITQNTENSAQKVDTSTAIDPNSILVCLNIPGLEEEPSEKDDLDNYIAVDTTYGEDMLAKNYIAKVIQAYKTLGCGTSGNIPVDLDDIYTVRFSLVEKINITIEIKTTYNNSAVMETTYTEIQDRIKQTVEDYINSFGIGKDVLFNDILSMSQQIIMSYGYNNNDVAVTGITITGTSTINTVNSKLDIYSDQIVELGSVTVTTDSGDSDEGLEL